MASELSDLHEWAKAHEPKLVHRERAHEEVHGAGPVGRFNTKVAVWITVAVGSMWCAYAFAALALLSLPDALHSGDPIIIVGWIAQTFLQLVLLPIIIVGQNVQAASSEARAQADHETLTAIHTLVNAVHEINTQQNVILDLLEKRTEGLEPPAIHPAP
ncbi:MAG: hypothetical protein IT338_13335 [Thermomicrobiales bacterium]|nr:hypothetical protein [Thermomicrobiales bacterium]